MTTYPTAPAPVLCADRWPALVTVGAAEPVRARVALTLADDHRPPMLWGWLPEHRDGAPILHWATPWTPAESDVPITGEGTWTVATNIGDVAVRSAGGCGRCGSTLGRWRPWHPMRWARMPRDLARPS